MTSPHQQTADAFNEVVAHWDNRVQCKWERGGSQCRRRAQWSVKVHKCDFGLLCTQHYRQGMVRVAEEWLADLGHIECSQCPEKFLTMSSCFTATRL